MFKKLLRTLKIIFNENLRKQHELNELKQAQIKYLLDLHISPSTIFVYGDKIAVINWSSERIAFLMRSTQVTDSYKSFLNFFGKWRSNNFYLF